VKPLLRACLLALLLISAVQAPETGIMVSGTRFVLTTKDGARRTSEELIGAVLRFAGDDGRALAIRIDRAAGSAAAQASRAPSLSRRPG
jgi:hypothetical protein